MKCVRCVCVYFGAAWVEGGEWLRWCGELVGALDQGLEGWGSVMSV